MVSGYKKSEIGLVPNDWDVLPFGEVFRTLSNNTLSRDQLNYDSGSIKDVHYGDVLILFSELLDCSRDDIPYVNSDAPLSCQSLQEGDVIISDTAEDETVGKAVEIVNQGKTNMVAGLHTIPCRVKNEKFASGWLGYFINSHYYHDQLLPYIHGTKVSSIARESLADTYIVKPSYEEQKRIVKALSDIGRLISESEELIAKYQAMKQGCLQHMFPRKDQTEPDMRLPGFSGAWEQRKLGDIYIERNERGNVELDILSVSIHHGISQNELDTDELGKSVRRSDDKSLYKHVYYGDLVFNMMRAWQGAIGVVKNEGMVSPAYISAIPDDSVFPEFMDYCLRRKCIINQINNLSYGVTDFRKRLYWEPFTRVTIMMPSVDEQRKITDIFRQLDHLITLHQRKCEKYKMIKQGMMEELLTGKVRLK